MSYKIIFTNGFLKDVKKAKKRNYDLQLLNMIIAELGNAKTLAIKHKPHKLKGEYKGNWECHIQPDWLLIWQETNTEIILIRTGTHADLF